MATTNSLKRKMQDELPVESENPSKIRKVEKIIQNTNEESQSPNEAHTSVVFNSGENNSTSKIRRKLSSILHFQKKYKYYCKKHNVLYLIEKTRKKSRELSKKSRDHLVNSFRSLDVTQNVSINPQQLLERMEVDFCEDGRDSFDQPASDSVMTECKVSRIYVTSDENENDNYLAQRNANIPWNQQSANKFSLHRLIHDYILCDESEDSDYEEGYTDDEDSDESSKDENFILTRSPGGTSVIMKKINNFSDVSYYYDDCCTHHNCALKHHFKNNSHDHDSSFDED